MSAAVVAARVAQRIRDDLADPLFRNAYSLMLATVITSGVGILYWVAAARLYTTEEVGQAAAVIAAMLTLANVAQLNLTSGLVRFLPRSGSGARRLVGGAYLSSGVAALVLATGLLAVAPTMSAHLGFLVSSPAIATAFVVGTVSWCVFSLQDAALTGLRRTTWVPVENAAFSVTKMLLLVAMVPLLPRGGILLSWIVPMVIALIPVNLFLFRRVIPENGRGSPVATNPRLLGEVTRFVSVDYVGTLLGHACTTALPLIVVAVAGAEANAKFYMSWTVATVLDLIAVNTALSLTVEGSLEPAALARRRRQALQRCMRLFLPAVAAVVLFAPMVLQAFGSEYANGSTLLRLLALAVVPRAVVLLYLASLRVERRVGRVVVVQAIVCAGMLGATVVLLPVLQVEGVGVAWLATQLAMAAFALPALCARVEERENT
jgi:O-antigen/teichoic acid export membrane protein